MTILPVPSNPSNQWSLADFSSEPATTAPADATGIITATFGPVPDDELWLFDRISVTCNSPAATACTLYLDSADPSRAMDYTPAGNADIADEAQPIQVPATSMLLVQWTGATLGAVGVTRAQWRVLRRPRS